MARAQQYTKTIKDCGKKLLFRLQVFNYYVMLTERRESKIRVISYHRIKQRKNPFFPGVEVRNFESQIQFLRRHYQIVDLEKVLEAWSTGKDIPSRAVCLTFDDGSKDTFSDAFPILVKYRLPATIFLATDFIDSSKIIWTDKVNCLFERTEEKSVEFTFLKEMEFKLNSVEEKVETLNQTKDFLKGLPQERREKCIEEIEKKLKVNPREVSFRPEMLSWTEVKKMAESGIKFGAHTQSHPILTQIPIGEAEREIKNSKNCIEEITGQRVCLFAYPNGLQGDYNEQIKQIVKNVGFKFAFTNINGLIRSNTDPFELPRINETNAPLYVFAGRVSGLTS